MMTTMTITTSTTAIMPRVIKSALKRVSSYGSLNMDEEDIIPISTKKSAWKILPVPILAASSTMRRTESTASFFHSDYNNNNNAEVSTDDYDEDNNRMNMIHGKNHRMTRNNVSFSQIRVRDYDNTLGDNPACGCGPPLSLDWHYTEHAPLDLDAYEDNRPQQQRRTARQMHLNSYQRQHILEQQRDISAEELQEAKRQAQRVQRQRAVTAYFATVPACMKLEDLVESAARKAKRMLQKNKRHGKKNRSNSISGNTATHGSSSSTSSISTMRRSRSFGWLHIDDDDTIASGGANSSVALSVQTI